MKKIIFTLAAFFAATCLSSCALFDALGQYDELNEMLTADYSKVTLTATTSFDGGLSLVSEYVIDYSGEAVTVNYSLERFSALSLEAPADGEKTTLTGVAEIKDGAVVIIDGAAVTIRADIAELGMKFKKSYFTNVDMGGVYFKADVKNASGFMGTDLDCTDMKVAATFLEFFCDLKITYDTESGNSVELLYAFTL